MSAVYLYTIHPTWSGFVVHRWTVRPNTIIPDPEPMAHATTIEAARAALPANVARLETTADEASDVERYV